MPRTPITRELLEKYGISVAPPDDPIYTDGFLVILGGEPAEQSPEAPQPEVAADSEQPFPPGQHVAAHVATGANCGNRERTVTDTRPASTR